VRINAFLTYKLVITTRGESQREGEQEEFTNNEGGDEHDTG
jgi:hypothetical protein